MLRIINEIYGQEDKRNIIRIKLMMKNILILNYPAVISFLIIGISFNYPVYAVSREELSNYEKTKSYYNSLISDGYKNNLQLARLNMFMATMPKGGDIHHHYSGALYVENYLDWIGKKDYCIWKNNYTIETNINVINTQKKLSINERSCLSVQAVEQDDNIYRELLQKWSDKDFIRLSKSSRPADGHFFDTFNYFGQISGVDYKAGLNILKKRAIQENVQYLETMMESAPKLLSPDTNFDEKIKVLVEKNDKIKLKKLLLEFIDGIKKDVQLNEKLTQYINRPQAMSTGLDDDNFTLRFQSYTSRNNSPSIVFSGLYTAFFAASKNPLIVGVNLVGPENGIIAMRDYILHMQMIHFLKKIFPGVRLSLHAGELTLGMVPPEGLNHHIRDAISIAGAERIGHGVDIVLESEPFAILDDMRTRKVAIEINLTSNEFILGVKNEDHPITIYMTHGIPLVISTDDAGVSRNNLTSQYVLYASRYKPSYDELKETIFNSIRYSFLTEEEKKQQVVILEKIFNQFEAQIASIKFNRNTVN